MKLKVGIFFGGPSREREISFAGGRTVYDNLNAQLFEPIPIFVDQARRFIILDWHHIYKGSIRDFYPPASVLAQPSGSSFQIYSESLTGFSEADWDQLIGEVGEGVAPEDLPHRIHMAFLALHGEYGEDGAIQRQLEDLGIPYTGSGVRASEIGMDKALQKELMAEKGFAAPRIRVLPRPTWIARETDMELYQEAVAEIGFPLVIRPSRQGSSIGVSIIDRRAGWEGFREAVDRAFFRERIPLKDWLARSEYDRRDHIRLLTDIRDGLGFPMDLKAGTTIETLFHPDQLKSRLDELSTEDPEREILLESHHDEQKVLLEEFINGKEFSCIVIRLEDGSAVALPPTEILKGGPVFDYRSKYMPGMSRKRTPIELPTDRIQAICRECERLFVELEFQVYARIDGFIQEDGTVFLNDPNTTSGMLPSSFFFHQAAEIGLNPSQFLTYIIRTSLQERLTTHPDQRAWKALRTELDEQISRLQSLQQQKQRVGIILGGYSFERHISVESGRNIYEKLASSDKYVPYPIFLSREQGALRWHQIPINLLLKDNADDIRDKLTNRETHSVVKEIQEKCVSLTRKYGSAEVIFHPEEWHYPGWKEKVDQVFIALHGRPGEDGEIQSKLDEIGIPYNGAGPESSAITIDKFRTLELLRQQGFKTARQELLHKVEFQEAPEEKLLAIELGFGYPLIAKPVDDGCSSAVQLIRDRDQLKAYVQLLFREAGDEGLPQRKKLKIRPREEFPIKEVILFETLIGPEQAIHFLEITGGMLTHLGPEGQTEYEVFEPSETLATGEVLSLEEKFLAGEGQNITPARLAPEARYYGIVAKQVKSELERAARLLDIEGYCRIDAFVRVFPGNLAELVIIEVNSLPGMTPATAIFHQAALNGYKPYDFIDRILTFAADKKEYRKNSLPSSVPINAPVMSAPDPGPVPDPTSQENQQDAGVTKPSGPLEPVKRFFERTWSYIWEYISSPFFLKNLIGLIAAIILLFFLTATLLRWYTNHGKSYKVHNYQDMKLEDAIKLAAARSFRVEVDTGFVLGKPKGIVLQQTPPAGRQVKKNRTIYLVVNGKEAPLVKIPSLAVVDNYTTYCADARSREVDCQIRAEEYNAKLAKGTIERVYLNGNDITRSLRNGEMRVPKGSVLEMVITTRSSQTVPLPNLICLTYREAQFNLSGNNLEVGRVFGNPADLENAYIVRQEPAFAPGKSVSMGVKVDLYLSENPPANCGENGQ